MDTKLYQPKSYLKMRIALSVEFATISARRIRLLRHKRLILVFIQLLRSLQSPRRPENLSIDHGNHLDIKLLSDDFVPLYQSQ